VTPITLADLEFLGVDRCYRHTAWRFLSRFGVRLDPGAYLRLCTDLAEHLPTLRPTPGHGTRCLVWYRVAGKLVELVFDWHSGLVITVLTPPPLRRYGRTGVPRTRHTRTYRRRGKHRHRWEEEI